MSFHAYFGTKHSAVTSADTIGLDPRQLAELPRLPSATADRLMTELAAGRDPVVRAQVVEELTDVLEHASPLASISWLTHCALSRSANVRRLVGEVLAADVMRVGAATIVEHLSVDPTPSVRAQAAVTARALLARNPVAYRSVLRRLSADPDPLVVAAVTR